MLADRFDAGTDFHDRLLPGGDGMVGDGMVGDGMVGDGMVGDGIVVGGMVAVGMVAVGWRWCSKDEVLEGRR